MALAPGKKRYYLTLTEDRWESFKTLLRDMGAPRGMESEAVDEFVAGILPTMQHFWKIKTEQGRTPTIADLMVLLGGLLKDIGEDEQLKL